MIQVVGPFKSGVAAGGAGVATANADSTIRVNGFLVAIDVKYNDAPPATTDVVIKTVGANPARPSLTLLTLTNAAADKHLPVEEVAYDNVGVANGDNVYPAIDDFINVKIDQANNGDSVDVWLTLVN